MFRRSAMATRYRGLTTYDGFHPSWRDDTPLLAPFRDEPLWLGSFYDARAPEADIFYSNELPAVRVEPELIHWSWARWRGAARWYLGTPRVNSPRALHVPFFYQRWGELRHAPRPTPERVYGVSFLSTNVDRGELAKARLELAIALARHLPLHTTEALRRHFPADTRAIFHPLGPTLDDKIAFVSRFTFHLCFENARADGYLTEKPFEALWAGAVPIYAGDPGVGDWLETEAVLDVSGLDPDAVMTRIEEARRHDLPGHVAGRREALVRVPFETMMARVWDFAARAAADLDARAPDRRSAAFVTARRAALQSGQEWLAGVAWRRAVRAVDELPLRLRALVPRGLRRSLGRGFEALTNRLRR